MRLCTVFLAVVITVNIDLAHCRYESNNFPSETIRLWYKKIYDALNNYQHVPQPDYTKCYMKNSEFFTPKLEDDILMRKLIDEMKSIVINSSVIAQVSKVAEFPDYFNEIENTYHQLYQRISNDNDPDDQKKLTNITKLHLTRNESKIKITTDEMDRYIDDGISGDENVLNTSQINQNFMNLLTQNCTRHVKLCSSGELLGQKLIDVYGYLASIEVKMVALAIDDFLHGIFYNSKDVISEFRKIINGSIRRTRIYVILILRMDILKKSKFTPKLNSVTRTDESHASGRNDKEKGLESRSFVPQHKPKYSSIMDKNKTEKNKAVHRATQKTLIQISKWKDGFLRQLGVINDRIDLIWCANTPSYRQRDCHENEFEIPCEMKTLNKASKPNIIAEMWNISKDVMKLLDTVVRPPTTEIIFRYGDIFNFSKSTDKYSEKEIFTDILQTYDTTINLSNSWDGVAPFHFEKLLNKYTKFQNQYEKTSWDISNQIHTTIFNGCEGTKIWQAKLKKNCKHCSTDELLKTELSTIFSYLAVTEMKIFIIDMFVDILRTLILYDDVLTNSTTSNAVFNQVMFIKSHFFLASKDYLDEINGEYNMTLLECKPFSWKTDIKSNYTLPSDYYLRGGLLPAGILNFAVKSLGKSVSIKLGHEIGLYHVKIVISLPSITITMMGNKNKTEIYKDYSIKFLLARKFIGYWIKWKGRELSVGRARNSTAIIKITDVNTSILSHFTISNADWILYDLPSSHQIDDNKSYRETCWVDNTVKVGHINGIACRIPSDRRDGYKLGTPWNNKCHVPIGKSQLMPHTSNYEVLVGTLLPGNEVIGDIKTTGEPLYVCPSWNSSTNGDDFDRNYCRPRLIYNDPTEY